MVLSAPGPGIVTGRAGGKKQSKMKVIRDENQNGDTPAISMLPILTDWGINRCNVKACTRKPTTIIRHQDAGVFGMCEKHYQESVKAGKVKLQLEL